MSYIYIYDDCRPGRQLVVVINIIVNDLVDQKGYRAEFLSIWQGPTVPNTIIDLVDFLLKQYHDEQKGYRAELNRYIENNKNTKTKKKKSKTPRTPLSSSDPPGLIHP